MALFPADNYDEWKSVYMTANKWSVILAFGSGVVALFSAFFFLTRFHAQNKMDALKDSKQGEKLISQLDNPPLNYERIYAELIYLEIAESYYSKYKSLLDKASGFPPDTNHLAGVMPMGQIFAKDTYAVLVNKFTKQFFTDKELMQVVNSSGHWRSFYALVPKNDLLEVISNLRKVVDDSSISEHARTIHFMLQELCGDEGVFLPEFNKRFSKEQLNQISNSWTPEELIENGEWMNGVLKKNGLLK